MNIIVGDNESGKSTLLEAIALALTGKVNGQRASEELNPFWFNHDAVADFFAKYGTAEQIAAPEILIELYLSDSDSLQPLRGVHNSLRADCPGVLVRVAPSDQYADEFAAYLKDSPPAILPVEFYGVDWRDLTARSDRWLRRCQMPGAGGHSDDCPNVRKGPLDGPRTHEHRNPSRAARLTTMGSSRSTSPW